MEPKLPDTPYEYNHQDLRRIQSNPCHHVRWMERVHHWLKDLNHCQSTTSERVEQITTMTRGCTFLAILTLAAVGVLLNYVNDTAARLDRLESEFNRFYLEQLDK